MAYDQNNIFAKILRGEIPSQKVFEDDHILAFKDIHPRAPVHVIVIPKKAYVSFADFSEKASPEDIAHFFKVLGKLAETLGIREKGYRLITNHGPFGGQEVPHFHMHILGGAPVGDLVGSPRP